MSTLAPAFRKLTEAYRDAMADSYGTELISLVVYGSAARGDFSEKNSDINILVVLTDNSAEKLKKAARIGFQRRFKRINPVFFTEEFMRCSADVFPIEFLDMKENFILLHGTDVLSGLEVNPEHLRFQCEHELKSRLLQMKKAYVAARTAGELRKVLLASAISLVTVLKNTLRLTSAAPAGSAEDTLSRIESEYGIDVGEFRKTILAKQQNSRLTARKIEGLFIGVTATLERIISSVDTFQCPNG